MNQIGWRLLQIVVFLVLASPARAESVKLIMADYYPLAEDTTPGESEICGIEYAIAIETLKGEEFVVSGSINTDYGVPNRAPLFFIGVRASQITNDIKVKPIKLKYAELRFGSHDTRKFAQIPDEPNALLLVQVDPNVALEWVQIANRVNEGFWITAEGIGLNATFMAPPFSDEDLETYRGFAECQASALKKHQEWRLKGGQK